MNLEQIERASGLVDKVRRLEARLHWLHYQDVRKSEEFVESTYSMPGAGPTVRADLARDIRGLLRGEYELLRAEALKELVDLGVEQ